MFVVLSSMISIATVAIRPRSLKYISRTGSIADAVTRSC